MRFKLVRSFSVIGFSVLMLLSAIGWVGRSGLPIVQASPDRSPQATARYVANSGTDTGTCNVNTSPCRTIQYAVDRAVNGDNILVSTGTYTDVHVRPRNDITVTGFVTQVVYLTKTLTLRGGYTTTNWTTAYPLTQPTTLDAQRAGRVIYITGKFTPTIEGFRLTHGSAPANGNGGGLYIITATVTLSNNWIVSNTASSGGGLSLRSSRLRAINNRIFGNAAFGSAGLEMNQGNAALQDNLIYSNTSAVYAGGLYFLNNSTVVMTNNVIMDNRVINPGGYGAGLIIQQSTLRLLHTTLARNTGGDGSGLVFSLSGGQVFMTNTILVSQSIGISVTTGDKAILNGVLFYSNSVNASGPGVITVTNAYTGNPAFAADGYHLTGASTAINAGIPTSVTTDIDGQTRPHGPKPDIGADEFYPNRPTAVAISGSITGFLGGNYVFVANTTPLTAGTPLTYVWKATGQSIVTNTNNLTDAVAFTWSSAGTKVITVTAGNDSGIVTDTHSITIITVAPTSLAINAPTTGVINTNYAITATVSPITATTPFTYTWHATDYGGAFTLFNQGLTQTQFYNWSAPGVKTIVVTATNSAGTVVATHFITINKKVYLPLVLKNF